MISGLYDVLLSKPLPDALFQWLVFFTFVLHFLFALLTIGTALIGVTYFFRARLSRVSIFEGWEKRWLGTFFNVKSLAVVLGVAPILLMQVGNSVPFLTGIALLAPLWAMITLLLLAAFAFLTALEESARGARFGVVWAFIGLVCLLAVPGVFVAVLTAAENPDRWGDFLSGGFRLPWPLPVHWLFRFGHVLGAAVVFSAAYMLLLGRPEENKRRSLIGWVIGGLVFQFVDGVALLLSLPRSPTPFVAGVIVFGVAAGTLFLWFFYRHQVYGSAIRPLTGTTVGLLILLPMLMTRQMLQDRVLVPLNEQMAEKAAAKKVVIASQEAGAADAFRAYAGDSRERAGDIYLRSCAPCHGTVGNGLGDESANLAVPPEDLTASRATLDSLHQSILRGVPGTGMPGFPIYTKNRLVREIEFLRGSLGLIESLEPIGFAPSSADRRHAHRIFNKTCVNCHGSDGRGTAVSSGFRPPPPDFTVFSVSPRRAMEIVAKGYPGTKMPSWGFLPEATRWALIEIVHSFYGQDRR